MRGNTRPHPNARRPWTGWTRSPRSSPGLLQEPRAGIPEDWDRHYLLFQEGDFSLIITERAYIAILIITLSGMLLYSLAFRKGMRRYTRTLGRNLPALLPVTGIAFLFLFAGTLTLDGIQAVRGFPSLWSYVPMQFLVLKACVALFLYSVLYNAARRLPFPRNGTFYSAAALFILLVDIAVVAVFNISFTYYFLWAFIFVFFSALARPRFAKVLLFLPAPFWGVRGLIEVFSMPGPPSLPFPPALPDLGEPLHCRGLPSFHSRCPEARPGPPRARHVQAPHA